MRTREETHVHSQVLKPPAKQHLWHQHEALLSAAWLGTGSSARVTPRNIQRGTRKFFPQHLAEQYSSYLNLDKKYRTNKLLLLLWNSRGLLGGSVPLGCALCPVPGQAGMHPVGGAGRAPQHTDAFLLCTHVDLWVGAPRVRASC